MYRVSAGGGGKGKKKPKCVRHGDYLQKRSHSHMGDIQLKIGYNSILSAKKDVNLR